MPRRIKFRKAHKSMGFNETICPNTRQLAFGLYGIRAMEHCRIPARTLEAARRTLRRTIKKSAMLWIRVTPNVPVTSKPAEVRMGKGKGSLDYWAAPIRPGQVLFEMDRCSRNDVLAALHSIQSKMPIKLGFLEWS
ncbi:ribosomal protein L10e/L16 [Scenedesmus sp. NREL 46B-D3]|nr:ribosomal protein L10e/L16 [Scenedesmus sp. NREL 46B-D3]